MKYPPHIPGEFTDHNNIRRVRCSMCFHLPPVTQVAEHADIHAGVQHDFAMAA